MKLCIISHTEHFKTQDGHIVGWGPTVNEINHLLDVFDTIYHIAMFHADEAPPSALPYSSDKIIFVPIPAVGGTTLLRKLDTVFKAAQIIKIVTKTLKQVDYFQLRTPTGIGVFLIPYLTFFTQKKGCYKYAGNWNQKHPPLGYALQRWMLKKQSRKVTINGAWEFQPKHCITFENPCLTVEDITLGQEAIDRKSLEGKLSFCFVGRLECDKGVERIIEAFTMLPKKEQSQVNAVHLVGNGADLEYFKILSANCGVPFKFHGFLSRAQVFEIYKESHIFLLPTIASEGFPKVIAEALNFGCVPIVSNISSIGQYVKHAENGFLMDVVTSDVLLEHLQNVMHLTTTDYIQLKARRSPLIHKFTFSHYNQSIQTKLLND